MQRTSAVRRTSQSDSRPQDNQNNNAPAKQVSRLQEQAKATAAGTQAKHASRLQDKQNPQPPASHPKPQTNVGAKATTQKKEKE